MCVINDLVDLSVFLSVIFLWLCILGHYRIAASNCLDHDRVMAHHQVRTMVWVLVVKQGRITTLRYNNLSVGYVVDGGASLVRSATFALRFTALLTVLTEDFLLHSIQRFHIGH